MNVQNNAVQNVLNPHDTNVGPLPHGFQLVTDMDRVHLACTHIPQLAANGPMYPIASAAALPADLKVFHGVDMDTIGAIVVPPGHALCTSALATCVMFAAQGTDSHGRNVIALLHQSADFRADQAIKAMRYTMTDMDVNQYRTFVLGGELSRNPRRPGSVVDAIKIATAAANEGKLACGRVGVNQMSQKDVDDQGLGADALPAWPGVPDRPLCAVLTAHGIYYAPEAPVGGRAGEYRPSLFDERAAQTVGDPLPQVLQKAG
jgi:hypothetical protein